MHTIVDLSGKVALVTGAGDGVGRAVAEALARAGAAVLVSAVNPTAADATAADINAAGGRALGWPVDLGNKFQVAAMIERLRDEFGGLHIVVNAWSVNKRASLLMLDEYDWRRVIEVNLTGAFLLSQLAARVMADEGGGVIVQVGGPPAEPGAAAYAASQGGVRQLFVAMDVELAPAGVRAVFVPAEETAQDTVGAVLAALAHRNEA